jgi:Tol biopolymer transport system component
VGGRIGVIGSVVLGVIAFGGNAVGHARNGAVVFESNRGSGQWAAYVTNTAGTATRRLAPVEEPNDTCHSAIPWSRDGEHLAYAGVEFGLRIYDVHTGRVRNLVPGDSSCDTYSLSPDGSKLAYTGLTSAFVVDEALHHYTVFKGSPDVSADELAWSPDGAHIAYVRSDEDLEVATADGKSRTVVDSNVGTVQPVWSPDGQRLAYGGQSDGNGDVFVDVVDADGSNRQRLSVRRAWDGNIAIDWSPDGNRVVFSIPTGTYVVDADGTHRRRIADGGLTSISWSPDGRLIVYTAGKPSVAWLMNADGSHAHPLPIDLPLGGDVANVSWNPVGVPVQAIVGTPIHIARSQLGEPTGPLAVFSAATGARIRSFPAVSGGSVDTIVADGAGGWFVGGAFNHVGATGCARLAHVLANFRLDRSFCGKADDEVQALAVLDTTLYVGGTFDKLAGATRMSFGALDMRSAGSVSWQPLRGLRYPLRSDEGPVGLAALGRSVYLLGPFSGDLGGAKREQLAAVDPVSAAVQPWAPKIPLIPVGLHVETTIDQVAPSPGAVYVDGRPYGDLEALDARSGALIRWQPVHGHDVVWNLALAGSRLYLGGRFGRIDSAARNNLAAVDPATRALLPWAPQETQPVLRLGASPSAVWAAVAASGETRIDGFDASTGHRLAAHVVVRGGQVAAIAASNSIVLVGGDFDSAQFH